MVLKFDWTLKHIQTNQDAEDMRELFKQTGHFAAAFDTETDGLNIIRCKPFLYQFGWIDTGTNKGYAFVVDLQAQPQLARQVIKVWHAIVKYVEWYVGANVKYDMHMEANIDLPYLEENLTDLQSWIRLGTDAIPVRKGGAPLALKDFAARYIDPSAKEHEKLLDNEKTAIAKALNGGLRKALGWYQYQIDDFFDDKVHDVSDLPDDKKEAWHRWHQTLPEYLQPVVLGKVDSDMIRYDTLNRANVIKYSLYDIVWTLEAFDMLYDTVTLRENIDALFRENANIIPVYNMERVGFEVDKDYLYEAQRKTKEYILIRRQDMYSMVGKVIGVGQHAEIKNVLATMGIIVESTGADELDILLSKLKHEQRNPAAIDFIEVVQELRTLEKWYSTYIMRFIVDMKYGDKVYTQVNLSGAVSGRVTSDFQQFPKDAIKTIDGVELFRPRRLFKVPKGYKGMVYLDFSQIELRLQAMYTLLVGTGDLNLCRAYMPFQCHSFVNTPFDYTNSNHIKHAYDTDWYLDEAPEVKWTPTDVHGATTKAAFGIDETAEEFHDLRYVGKRVNFAKNYGAQRGKIAEMFPDYDDATIDRIDQAYYIAFPGVKDYHKYCYALVNRQPYGQNLFGRRYYNVSGHNLINMLIQGTGADVLKTIKPKIAKYLKDNNCKTVMQMEIHDELSFCWHEDDDAQIFFDIKAIMEDFSDFLVPIVAEMEVTYTTWADKKGVHNVEELRAA